jgi:hypothetical protein
MNWVSSSKTSFRSYPRLKGAVHSKPSAERSPATVERELGYPKMMNFRLGWIIFVESELINFITARIPSSC